MIREVYSWVNNYNIKYFIFQYPSTAQGKTKYLKCDDDQAGSSIHCSCYSNVKTKKKKLKKASTGKFPFKNKLCRTERSIFSVMTIGKMNKIL